MWSRRSLERGVLRAGRVVVAEHPERHRRRELSAERPADVSECDGEAVGLGQRDRRTQDEGAVLVRGGTAVHLGPVGNQLAGVEVHDDGRGLLRDGHADLVLGRQRGVLGGEVRDVDEDRRGRAEAVVAVPGGRVERGAVCVREQAGREVDPAAGAGGGVLNRVLVARERQQARPVSNVSHPVGEVASAACSSVSPSSSSGVGSGASPLMVGASASAVTGLPAAMSPLNAGSTSSSLAQARASSATAVTTTGRRSRAFTAFLGSGHMTKCDPSRGRRCSGKCPAPLSARSAARDGCRGARSSSSAR